MPDTLMRHAHVDMSAIENGVRDLAAARRALEQELQRAEARLSKVRLESVDRLRNAVEAVRIHETSLLMLVERAAPLFRRPQSIEIEGVRVGWRKGKGRLELPPKEDLIKKIADVLTAAQKKTVLQVKTSVLKGALAKLPGEILKKLGVSVTGAGQEPFVTYPATETEKLVAWWLNPSSGSLTDAED
jgi:hypothetical protein